MASQSERPREGNPEYGNSFTREEITALAAFFHGLGLNVDIEREGKILDVCELISNSFSKSGIKLQGSPGRALAKARQVKEQMLADLDRLAEAVLPLLEDESLQDYLKRNDLENLKFPLDVRAAVSKLKLNPYLEKGERLCELVPDKNAENQWLVIIERLSALYDYCRQISQMPRFRDDEAKIKEAEQLSNQLRKELMEKGVLFRQDDREISNMVILQTAITLGRNGKA